MHYQNSASIQSGMNQNIKLPSTSNEIQNYSDLSIRSRFLASQDHATFSKGHRILLVDGDREARKKMIAYLCTQGHEVDIASTGTSAMRLAHQNDYDLIFFDICLPDVEGRELLQELYSLLGYKTILIALTSYDSEEDHDFFISHGAMTVLVKPVSPAQLKSCIQNALLVKELLRKDIKH